MQKTPRGPQSPGDSALGALEAGLEHCYADAVRVTLLCDVYPLECSCLANTTWWSQVRFFQPFLQCMGPLGHRHCLA